MGAMIDDYGECMPHLELVWISTFVWMVAHRCSLALRCSFGSESAPKRRSQDKSSLFFAPKRNSIEAFPQWINASLVGFGQVCVRDLWRNAEHCICLPRQKASAFRNWPCLFGNHSCIPWPSSLMVPSESKTHPCSMDLNRASFRDKLSHQWLKAEAPISKQTCVGSSCACSRCPSAWKQDGAVSSGWDPTTN